MANPLTTWLGDVNELTTPKPLEMAKALRKRKQALNTAPRQILQAGEGNIFQRRRQGIDEVERQATQ